MFFFFFFFFSKRRRFFLFKAEEKSGIISDQFKALDCQTNGLLTSLESKVKPIWKTGYVTYKKATAAVNCYALDTYDRLKLPFVQGGQWMNSYFSNVHDDPLTSVALGFWKTFSTGLCTIANALQNAIFHFCYVLIDFFTDVLSAASNLFVYTLTYLKDVFFTVFEILKRFLGNFYDALKKSVLNVWSYLYLLLFSTKDDDKILRNEMSEKVMDTSLHYKSSPVKSDELKNIAWDLSNFKKRFDELESEFRKEKQSVKMRNDFYNKQFENNNLALQKYETVLNRAVSSAKKPDSITNSTVQYLLDNHFNELKQWILENFMLKIDSPNLDENKIVSIIAKHLNKTGEELMILKEEFKRFTHDHDVELKSVKKDFGSLITSNMGGDISDSYIRKIVNDAIKLYDADKTGRVDFALESAGGQIVSIRCTETYMASPKSYVLMGWPLFTKASSPRDAITHTTAAGQCWAFVGSQGFLVIQLSHNIKVTGFTMEHMSRLLAPNGHIESAPKNFSMWGLKMEHDSKPYLFGEYIYLDNDETLQYFPVAHPTSEKYQMVELKIASNHGNPNYTCLYRIRVHGNL
ncbi:conserved hypothetical protein [Pediculus humanus corporis]|uniref:SUN domain-containing protein n=1 Tax=Pediculus humanus subsp. corporis TaxID=121224 RepID=E0VIY0_PEDHC|nr:uncharacterized protein Phum_PHUM235450 [Pediculus humanus corporis]EEB13336.1 conserved hypothetical protein [Pediculus humanus corporis]